MFRTEDLSNGNLGNSVGGQVAAISSEHMTNGIWSRARVIQQHSLASTTPHSSTHSRLSQRPQNMGKLLAKKVSADLASEKIPCRIENWSFAPPLFDNLPSIYQIAWETDMPTFFSIGLIPPPAAPATTLSG